MARRCFEEPMNILPVLGHPAPGSFNHAVAGSVREALEALRRRCVLDLCGVPAFHRRVFEVVVTSRPRQREAWLREAGDLCREVFRETGRKQPGDA